MTSSMVRCKRRLALLWFAAAGLLFLILFLQTVLGRYGNESERAWSWFLPSVMPTLSLMLGVMVADAMAAHAAPDTPGAAAADPFFFTLTFAISLVYLGALLILLLFQPFSSLAPTAVMTQSNLWLGPFQGLVAASMGAFFVKRKGDSPEGK
jgi:hypothetical protein